MKMSIKINGWQIIVVIVTSLVVVGLVGCGTLTGGSEITSQQLFEVRKSDLNIRVSSSGNIQPDDDVSLTFSTSGRIDRIYVEEGDEVNEGDILAKLDTDYLELALTQAQVALTGQELAVSQAEVNVTRAEVAREKAEELWLDTEYAGKRIKRLKRHLEWELENDSEDSAGRIRTIRVALQEAWDSFFIYARDAVEAREVTVKEREIELAKQSLEQSKRSLQQFQQALEQAQKDLSEATITTPFDGIIAKVYVEEGDMVPNPTLAAAPVIQLVNYERMELLVEIDEMDIPYVKAGQEARINVDALPGAEFVGEVTTIFPVPREIAGVVLYDVTIKFDVPVDSRIRVGMNATANMTFTERSNVLLISTQVIGQDNEGNPMVKVTVGDQIQEKLVIVGVSNGFETEIISGLSEGDMVVNSL